MRHIKGGWKFLGGLLEKGDGKKKAQALPGFDMPGPFPGDRDFNPKVDAYAVRMGAEFRSDNYYWHPKWQQWLDRNGSPQIPPGPPLGPRVGIQGVDWECPECGGSPWHVLVDITPPGAAIRKYAHAPCRQCVPASEIEDARRRRDAAAPQRRN